MNTRVEYLYRDAGNNKVHGDEVVAGGLSEEGLRVIEGALSRFPEHGFIPEKVGLPVLSDKFVSGGGFDPDLDHCWHEWEGAKSTDDVPTVQMGVEELVAAFEQAAGKGWDEFDKR